MTLAKLFTVTLLTSTSLASVSYAQTIDYGMMASLFNEPVTASATGKPQRASDAPVSMKIISHEEISRSGAKDIPQLLQRIAGVQVQRSYIGRADVSIRGYGKPYANRLLVLVNGRQALSDALGQTPWEALSIGMEEIQQIEVIKGPNSSLYGFNAESGVINIITFNPMNDNIDAFKAKLGTQEHKQFDLTHTARFDNFGVRVSAGSIDSDGFNRDSMKGYGTATSTVDKSSKNEWNSQRVNLDTQWQISENTSVRAQFGQNNNNVRVLIPFAASSISQKEFNFEHLTVAHEGTNNILTSNIYHVASNDHYTSRSYNNDLIVAQISNLFKVKSNHTLRLAAEYRDNQLTGTIIGKNSDTFSQKILSPSVMWDWKIDDKWSWTNSARYDHADYSRNADATFGPNTSKDLFNRSIDEYSYNSGLVYQPTELDTLRFSISRGLHIPSLIELGSSAQEVGSSSLQIGFAGNPKLEPERITSYELAWEKSFPQSHTNFTSAVFLQKAENIIGDKVSVLAGPVYSLTFENQGDSDTYGLELGLDGLYNNWLHWGANYTFLKTDDKSNNGLAYEDAQADHQISITAGFGHKNWEFDTDIHYVSGYTSSMLNTTGTVSQEKINGYITMNARAGYNVNKQLNIALEGYNLAEKHREWLLNGTSVTPVGGNTLGRTILATLTYKY